MTDIPNTYQFRVDRLVVYDELVLGDNSIVPGLNPSILDYIEAGLTPDDPWASSTATQIVSSGIAWVKGNRFTIPEMTMVYPYIDGNPNYTTYDEITVDGQYVNVDYNPVVYIPSIPPANRMRVRSVWTYGEMALTVDAGANTFHCTETNVGQVLRNNYPIQLKGTALPSPLLAETDYYFVNVTNGLDPATNSFQLATSVGGSPIDVTSAETDVKIAPGILASYRYTNGQAAFHRNMGGNTDWKSAILSLKITSGTYAGAFRTQANGGIQWGFVTDALRILAKYFLPEIKAFLQVSFGHLTANYTQHDLAYDLTEEIGQDADDAYGASLVGLACDYVRLSGDYQWLYATSAFTHTSQANLATMKALIQHDILDQIKNPTWVSAFNTAHPGNPTWAVPSLLISAFQGGMRDFDNSVYGAGMLMDACACAGGLRDIRDLCLLLDDYDWATYATAYYNLVNAIHGMYDWHIGIWAWVDVERSVTASGMCSAAPQTSGGSLVTSVSGSGFSTLILGNVIAIAGRPYQITSVISSTELTILESLTVTGASWAYGSYFMVDNHDGTWSLDASLASTTYYPDLMAGMHPEYFGCQLIDDPYTFAQSPDTINFNVERFNAGWTRLCQYYPDFWTRRISEGPDGLFAYYATKFRGNPLVGMESIAKFQTYWNGSGYIQEMAFMAAIKDLLVSSSPVEQMSSVQYTGEMKSRIRAGNWGPFVALAANSTINPICENIQIGAMFGYTISLSATPLIQSQRGLLDGQVLNIVNVGTSPITFNDHAVAGSKIKLPETTFVLYPDYTLTLIYAAAADIWRAVLPKQWGFETDALAHSVDNLVLTQPDGGLQVSDQRVYTMAYPLRSMVNISGTTVTRISDDEFDITPGWLNDEICAFSTDSANQVFEYHTIDHVIDANHLQLTEDLGTLSNKFFIIRKGALINPRRGIIVSPSGVSPEQIMGTFPMYTGLNIHDSNYASWRLETTGETYGPAWWMQSCSARWGGFVGAQHDDWWGIWDPMGQYHIEKDDDRGGMPFFVLDPSYKASIGRGWNRPSHTWDVAGDEHVRGWSISPKFNVEFPAWTDLIIEASDNTKIRSAGESLGYWLIGQQIQITGGSGFTPQTVTITAVENPSEMTVVDGGSISGASISYGANGTGYHENDIVSVAGGTGGTIKILAVSGVNGEVLGIEVNAGGSGYQMVAGSRACSGGYGTGLYVEINVRYTEQWRATCSAALGTAGSSGGIALLVGAGYYLNNAPYIDLLPGTGYLRIRSATTFENDSGVKQDVGMGGLYLSTYGGGGYEIGASLDNKANKAAITGATIPLAKITPGGTDGSITFSDQGVVTAYTPPT